MDESSCWTQTQNLLSETCQILVYNSKTGPKVFRLSSSVLSLLFSRHFMHSVFHSFTHLFIHCLSPEKTAVALVMLFPWIIEASCHELFSSRKWVKDECVWEGGTPAWLFIHCGPSKGLPTCYSIFDGHILMKLMRETLLACRYLISGSFESQRPDAASSAQINWL